MSKLEELIAELCPDGVEYKKLGDVSTITRGGNFQKKDYVENGIPCIHYGQIYTQYGLFVSETISFISEEKAKKQKMANTDDIIMAVTSENIDDVCKCVAWLGKGEIAVSGHTAIIQHSLNPKYLVYYLHSMMFYKQKTKLAHGTKVIEVTPNKLVNIIIPVPPLPVQSEIVRILDNFTELTAELTTELTTELTARKKQYEYYLNELLTFETSTPRIRLGDICTVITKGTTPKSYQSSGIAFVKTEAFDGSRIVPEKLSYVDEKTHLGFLKRSILKADDILITIAGATIGKCAMVPANILPANTNQALAIIRLADGNSKKYVMHLLQSNHIKEYMQSNIKGSAQPNLNLKQLNDFIIPLPSVEEQERIVAILDRFDTLCNDISTLLPAEIEERKKQYEYYRDKLLTFKQLS